MNGYTDIKPYLKTFLMIAVQKKYLRQSLNVYYKFADE